MQEVSQTGDESIFASSRVSLQHLGFETLCLSLSNIHV